MASKNKIGRLKNEKEIIKGKYNNFVWKSKIPEILTNKNPCTYSANTQIFKSAFLEGNHTIELNVKNAKGRLGSNKLWEAQKPLFKARRGACIKFVQKLTFNAASLDQQQKSSPQPISLFPNSECQTTHHCCWSANKNLG